MKKFCYRCRVRKDRDLFTITRVAVGTRISRVCIECAEDRDRMRVANGHIAFIRRSSPARKRELDLIVSPFSHFRRDVDVNNHITVWSVV